MARGLFWAPDLVSMLLPVHAAVLAINEAVERGVVEDTLAALQNPSALLENLREPLAAIYQELLAQAKAEKAASAQTRVRRSLLCRRGGRVTPKSSGRQDPARPVSTPTVAERNACQSLQRSGGDTRG